MSFSFTVQELAQIDLLWNLVEDQGLQERCLALAKRARCESSEIAPSSIRCGALGDSKKLLADRARRATVLRDRGLLPESSRTRGARCPTVLRDRGLLPESSRTRGARWATVLRRRGLLPPKDLEVEVARPSCRELPQGPQGTTASTTPPFVRAGYDCRNNTTVLSRPEAVGWAPLVSAGPLTTSLRGLWVSGLLPPGNVGTNEGAATLKPTKRHKGAATQKPTSERRNSRSNLGARGRDPRTLASWPLIFYKLSRQLLALR